MFFNFALECAIQRAQVNQDGLKFSGIHQLPAYAVNLNILGRSVHTMKNTEPFVATSKETGLEATADKTEYMVIRMQEAAII